MGTASKRLRLRFFPADVAAVEQILEHTKHSTQSNAIRAALALYQQAWSSKRIGCRIVFLKPGTGEMQDALDFSRSRGEASEAGKRVGPPRTEQSIEIRVTPSDYERIESLLALEAADTASEIVRRAVRLNASAILRLQDGWELAAISPSGDVLPLQLSGAGAIAGTPGGTPGSPSEPLSFHAQQGPRSGAAYRLPRSLEALIETLAARESCTPDLLLVDLVRTEALARLHGVERSEPVTMDASPALAGMVAAELAPEPAREVAAPLAVADPALDTLVQTLEETAAAVEDLIKLVEPRRTQGEQAQLTDLLFEAVVESEMAEASIDMECAGDDATQGQMLLGKARQINLRLANLMTLVQLQEKPKGRPKRTTTAVSKSQGAEEKAGWATTLTAGQNGEPQQQVVTSSSLVPLNEDDLDTDQAML